MPGMKVHGKAPDGPGSGETTMVVDSSGNPHDLAAKPLRTILTDGTERIIGMNGVKRALSVTGYRASGDTITIKYRPSDSDTWVTFGAYVADFQIAIRDPIDDLSIQRTAGAGTTSVVTLTA